MNEDGKTMGHPISNWHAVWFIIPDCFVDVILKKIMDDKFLEIKSKYKI